MGDDRLEVADIPTPIGVFRIAYRGSQVFVVDLVERGTPQTGAPVEAVRRRPPFAVGSPPHQLAEYFRRERDRFDLTPRPISSSEFDQKVWARLGEVPLGQTITYGELARQAGVAGAARAVGGAMRRNPIPIIVPCHRVVGQDGSIAGYGLGRWRKRWLLEREGAWPLKARSIEGPMSRFQRTLEESLGRPRHRPTRRGAVAAPTQ
jgi:methylated-DNA-[protein]-cysteine S-methyltransferase